MALASPQRTIDKAQLRAVDWSLTTADDPHAVHSLHPYPAKFVPALPRELIARLSRPGDLVVDPFCGSGTALVEALLLGRRTAGSDINPVAVLTSRVKTRKLADDSMSRLEAFGATLEKACAQTKGSLPLPVEWKPTAERRFRGLEFWFDEEIAHELSALRELCLNMEPADCRDVCLMCFSSIIVTVSRQDSDTRYVRREKTTGAGDVIRLFRRKLDRAIDALRDLAQRIDDPGVVHDQDARRIDYLEPESVSLVVTSPPYPNAWSYHLYHQNRILWLNADPWAFKDQEIGHHRAYSAANGSDASDFKLDMTQTFKALSPGLRPDAHVVVVVGDSIVRGNVVRNDDVVHGAADAAGLREVDRFDRPIDSLRKAFNPAIGKIKREHILIFQK